MKTPIAFVHASPAAILPLAQYYSREAPELEIFNLLDDGLLRLFQAGEQARTARRLEEMIATARDEYGARMVLVTCSAPPLEMMAELDRRAGIPVLKIDHPMARAAAAAGRRIGVAVTFEPTVATARQLLLEAAPEAHLEFQLEPEAYQALLTGDMERHDRLLIESIRRLDGAGVDCVVLAQVSMARVLSEARRACRVPVFSSLETSLQAARASLVRSV